jgi:tetratricopeptide (TPR) repeat protein
MLETIREYALAKLAESGQADATWRRLADYFLEQVMPHQLSDPSGGMLAEAPRLAPELDNLRALLAWSHSTDGAEEFGLRLAGSVMGLWIERGYWNEARGFLEAALKRAQPTAEASARARVLNGLGTLAYFQGQYAIGVVFLLDSLTLSRGLNDRLMTGATLNMLGEMAVEQGDAAGALPRYQESLALFRDLGNTKGVAWTIHNLGELSVMQEDVAAARAWFEEGLALSREIAEPAWIAWALHGLGLTAQLAGDFAGARQLHSQSLARYREYGEPNQFIPWAYQGLGQTALAQGDTSAAAQHLTEALRLFRDEGDRGAISFCLSGLAGVAVVDGEPKRAAQLYGAAESLRQSIGARQAPASRATRERLTAAAREQLGEAAFVAAWAEGQEMTVDQAIALALDTV